MHKIQMVYDKCLAIDTHVCQFTNKTSDPSRPPPPDCIISCFKPSSEPKYIKLQLLKELYV